MSSKLNPYVSGRKKYEKIKATTVFMEYKPNVPDTSILSMNVGIILTLKDKDKLSKKPTNPQPIARACDGSSSGVKMKTIET